VTSAVAENPGLASGSVPVDMVTASGSGLDPDITLANAYAQTARVASARGMTESAIRAIVDKTATGRTFGILGEPRVNVLALNLAIDAAK
jgi:K+-transporting ATPase ATPase C chain